MQYTPCSNCFLLRTPQISAYHPTFAIQKHTCRCPRKPAHIQYGRSEVEVATLNDELTTGDDVDSGIVCC